MSWLMRLQPRWRRRSRDRYRVVEHRVFTRRVIVRTVKFQIRGVSMAMFGLGEPGGVRVVHGVIDVLGRTSMRELGVRSGGKLERDETFGQLADRGDGGRRVVLEAFASR